MAKCEGRIGESIFLEISPDVLKFQGVKFTDDVSNKARVLMHDVSQAANLIDFDVLYNRHDWKDKAVQTRLQSVSKYEILVPHCITLNFIRNLPNG